jgi:hypothetical protein
MIAPIAYFTPDPAMDSEFPWLSTAEADAFRGRNTVTNTKFTARYCREHPELASAEIARLQKAYDVLAAYVNKQEIAASQSEPGVPLQVMRYSWATNAFHGDSWTEERQEPDGEWVKYEDIKHLLSNRGCQHPEASQELIGRDDGYGSLSYWCRSCGAFAHEKGKWEMPQARTEPGADALARVRSVLPDLDPYDARVVQAAIDGFPENRE